MVGVQASVVPRSAVRTLYLAISPNAVTKIVGLMRPRLIHALRTLSSYHISASLTVALLVLIEPVAL
jgi:hypothetical protein